MVVAEERNECCPNNSEEIWIYCIERDVYLMNEMCGVGEEKNRPSSSRSTEFLGSFYMLLPKIVPNRLGSADWCWWLWRWVAIEPRCWASVYYSCMPQYGKGGRVYCCFGDFFCGAEMYLVGDWLTAGLAYVEMEIFIFEETRHVFQFSVWPFRMRHFIIQIKLKTESIVICKGLRYWFVFLTNLTGQSCFSPKSNWVVPRSYHQPPHKTTHERILYKYAEGGGKMRSRKFRYRQKGERIGQGSAFGMCYESSGHFETRNALPYVVRL